ncbi:MAG: hypothetical protein EPN91_12900 [Salinibacterium sp.]|nr:MAG: hypothetical protein EPN91_12900 [Salinibacterium sp.]
MTAAEHREWMYQLGRMSIAEMIALLSRLNGTRLLLERQEQDLRAELEKRKETINQDAFTKNTTGPAKRIVGAAKAPGRKKKR